MKTQVQIVWDDSHVTMYEAPPNSTFDIDAFLSSNFYPRNVGKELEFWPARRVETIYLNIG